MPLVGFLGTYSSIIILLGEHSRRDTDTDMSHAPLGFEAKVQEVKAVIGAEATEADIMQLLVSSDYNVAMAIARFYEHGELAGNLPASEQSGESPTGPPVAAPQSVSMDRDGGVGCCDP
jgi:hypothetical protein